MADKIDNAKRVTPEQYAAGVDRGIQELQNRIKELSKATPKAKTFKAGRLYQTQLGRELLLENAEEVKKLKEDLKNALETASKAKSGYKIRYSQDTYQNLSANPNEVVYRYPYSDYYVKAHRGRKASSSSEKN
jgi:hypothetical protein